MAWQIRLARDAELDIERVLRWTYGRFGERKAAEYYGLIAEALDEIATDPYNIHAKTRSEIVTNARTYHLAKPGRSARHFFLYRVIEPDTIDVGRLLYDGIELRNHLPADFDP